MSQSRQSLQDYLETLREIILAHHATATTGGAATVAREPSSTEYFALIVSTLSSGASSVGETLPMMLKVLLGVIPSTSKAVLHSQFQAVAQTLLTIIQQHPLRDNDNDGSHTGIVCSAITALGKLLLAQDQADAFWSQPIALQSFNACLSFVDSSHSSIRKCAHEAILALLALNAKSNSQRHVLGMYFADFVIGVLDNCSRAAYKRAHSVIVLLESGLIHLPQEKILSLTAKALLLHACDIPRLSAAVFRMLDTFFQSPLCSAPRVSSASLLSLHALMTSSTQSEALAQSADVETHCHYYSALTSGFLTLLRVCGEEALPRLSDVLASVLRGCEADFVQVHTAIGAALKRLLQQLLLKSPVGGGGSSYSMSSSSSSAAQSQSLLRSATTMQWIVTHAKKLQQLSLSKQSQQSGAMPSAVRALLTLSRFLPMLFQAKLRGSWLFTLDAIRTGVFESLRTSAFASARSADDEQEQSILLQLLLHPLLETLASIQQQVVLEEEAAESATPETRPQGFLALSADVKASLNDSLGAALQCLGIPLFLEIIPFFAVEDDIQSYRDWITELFLNELRHTRCQLQDFLMYIHPVIEAFQAHPQSPFAQVSQLPLWHLLSEMTRCGVRDVSWAMPRMRGLFEGLLRGEQGMPAQVSAVHAIGRIARGVSTSHVVADQQVMATEASALVPLMLKLLEEGESSGNEEESMASRVSGSSFAQQHDREVVDALAPLLSVANETLVAAVAKKLLQLVLTSSATQQQPQQSSSSADAQRELRTAARWLSVLLAVMPSVRSAPLVMLIFKTLRPLLAMNAPLMLQKRAYALLFSLLKHQSQRLFATAESTAQGTAAVGEGIDAQRDLMILLSQSLLSTHVSARNWRLKCIAQLLRSSSTSSSSSSLLTVGETATETALQGLCAEVLLCLKDSNKKTREEATLIIQLLSQHMSTPLVVLQMLCAGLCAASPSTRAAAISALCIHLSTQAKIRDGTMNDSAEDNDDLAVSVDGNKTHAHSVGSVDVADGESDSEDDDEDIAYSHSHNDNDTFVQLLQQYLQLFPSVALLLTQHNVEQSKSILTLCKLCISFSDATLLRPVLPIVLQAITEQLGPLKTKFQTQTRNVMRKLIRKFGDAEVREHMPEQDIALLDYLAKQNRKQLRKRQQVIQERKSVRAQSQVGSDDRDEERETDYRFDRQRKVRGIRMQSSAVGSVRMDNDGEEDRDDGMVSRKRMRREQAAQSSFSKRATAQVEQLLSSSTSLSSHVHKQSVRFGNANSASRSVSGEEEPEVVVNRDGKLMIVASGSASGAGPRAGSITPSTASALRRGPATQSISGQTHKSASGGKKRGLAALRAPGADYRAVKAGGDVWKKGVALQPHAYIPLDPRLLSKKNKAAAIQQFGVLADSSKLNKQQRKQVRVSRKK